jgi:PAS domain S-box-containing protein
MATISSPESGPMSPSWYPSSPRRVRAIAVAIAVLSASVVVGGYLLFRVQRERLLGDQLAPLAAVADSRAQLVANWRRERRSDVRSAAAQIHATSVAAFELDGADRQHALEHLSAVCRSSGYRRAQVFDASGRLLLAVDANGSARPEPLPGDLFAALGAEPAGVLVEAVDGDERRRPRFAALGRLAVPGAVLALTVDAEAALFPPLDRWPLPSESAASLLVARRDDRWLELAVPVPGVAPREMRALDVAWGRAPEVVAAGVRAVVDGDGRAYYVTTRPIAGSAWLLATRIAREEVARPIALAAARVAVGSGLVVVALGFAALLVRNRARTQSAQDERARSAELRAIFEYAPDAIFLADPQFRVLEVNEQGARLLGRTRAELLGVDGRTLVAPEDVERRPFEIERIDDGAHVVGERTFVRPGGERVTIELSAGRLPDGRIVAFGRDLSERRALERRMGLLSRALDESPSPALIAGADGVTRYVNRSYTEVTGFTREELVGSKPRFFDPESSSHDRSALILAEALAGGWQGELVDRRKNDEIFFWRLHVHAIEEPDGGVSHLLAVGEDVTEQRRQSDRFRLARRLVRMGIFEWDFLRRELWWSEECFDVFGVDRASFRPTWERFLALVHRDDRELVERGFRRAVDGGPAFDLEFRVRSSLAVERRVRAVAEILRDGAGLPAAAVGVVLDVTDQRTAERTLEETREQLYRAQKMEALGRLAGGVAHDFNNLLGIILGYAGMLASVGPPDAEPRRQVEEIRRAAERAAELTRQLLAIGRRQALEVRAVELRPLLEEAERLLRRMVPENVEFAMTIAPGLEPVQADPTHLLQVLLNLALNARDAMPDGGRLTVSAERVKLSDEEAALADLKRGTYIRLEVADTGAGMPPEVLERAFEPFFTTKGEGGGSGLGLATVYGIVRQLGGNAELRSVAGEGTTARVLLPSGPRSVEDSGSTAGTGRTARGVRVLVVEDVAPLGQMIERMLAGRGCQVDVVESPAAALELAAQPGFAIDLLLTDLVLPGIDGRELARRLRDRFPEVKVVVMSGYSELLAGPTGSDDLGADAILPKPFTRDRLEEVIAAAMSGRPAAPLSARTPA